MSKVNFIHQRHVSKDGTISNRGGVTIAFRETQDGIEYAYAFCSFLDNFNKATGRVKASGRLNSQKYLRKSNLGWKDFINANTFNLREI